MNAERDFSTRRRARGSRPLDIALLALGGVALAWSVYSAASAWAELRQARASLESVRQEIAAAEMGMKSLQSAAAGEGALGARAVWSVEAPPPRVIGALAEMLPPDVRLETVVLRYGAQLEIEMTLTARSAAEYDLFLRALESSPAFDRVVLGEETRTDTVRASVRARYHAGAES